MGFKTVSIDIGNRIRWPIQPGAVTSYDAAGAIERIKSKFTTRETQWDFTSSMTTAQNYPALSSQWSGYVQQWLGLMSGDMQTLCVHPWQEGVGHGYGLHKTLSAKNVVATMATKLRDRHDPLSPTGDTQVLAVVFNCATLFDLADALDRFCRVLPIPRLEMVKRLAQRMSNHDTESLTTTAPGVNPAWCFSRVENIGGVKPVRKQVGEYMAQCDAVVLEQNEQDELRALIERKRAYVAAVKQAHDSALNNTGGAGRYFYTQAGSPQLCADAIVDSDDFSHSDVYSAGLLLAAKPGEMDFIKGVFGL